MRKSFRAVSNRILQKVLQTQTIQRPDRRGVMCQTLSLMLSIRTAGLMTITQVETH